MALGAQEDTRFRNPVSPVELERRWAAVRERMRDAKLDALIVQGAANFVGGGGYLRWIMGSCGGGTYGTSAILPRDGLATLIHHGALGTESNPEGRDKTAPGIGRRVGAPNFPAVHYTTSIDAEVVAREVKRAGYRMIGLVAPFTMYHGFASKLAKELSAFTITDATELIDPIKADKSAEEVALIRKAAQMQDDLFEKIRGYIRPGMKDYEVMAYSDYLGQVAGSESGYFLGSSAAPGQPASFRFKPQHGRQIREGDVFVWQAENNGPGGYFVHIARYFVFGKAPQELVDGFNACVEAQQFTLNLLKPEISCAEAFKEYNAYLKSKGLNEERRLHCHGQGYDLVERPLLMNDETMSVRGMLNIGIHPVIANQRLFATVCDNFLIQPDGRSERLHQTPQKLFEL